MPQRNPVYETLLFYNYTNIENPEAEQLHQRIICQYLNIKGRILIANEGINGTIEGRRKDTRLYIELLQQNPRYAGTHFKKSRSDGKAFKKLKVQVKPELVASKLGDFDIDPHQITGKYLEPEELKSWFDEGKKFYIVDMRNFYETEVGHFEGSVLFPEMDNFRDLPKVLPRLENLKGETILTVCTGGIRCEKASGFLLENGFNDVYQLKGGIHTYMEKYPNQNFKGKLYVFDERMAIGFNTESAEHEIIGKCKNCGIQTENYINYTSKKGERKQGLFCKNCIQKGVVKIQTKTKLSKQS